MTNNQKKFVYDLFYHKYDMIGKFNYINNVMNSCENSTTLDNAYAWGKDVLWKWFDQMENEINAKFGTLSAVSLWRYVFNRTKDLGRELQNNYTALLKGI